MHLLHEMVTGMTGSCIKWF